MDGPDDNEPQQTFDLETERKMRKKRVSPNRHGNKGGENSCQRSAAGESFVMQNEDFEMIENRVREQVSNLKFQD